MPSKTLKTITRYRHIAIVTYDPTAANGSAEAAWPDWRHIAPACPVTSAGKHQRVVFALVIDT